MGFCTHMVAQYMPWSRYPSVYAEWGYWLAGNHLLVYWFSRVFVLEVVVRVLSLFLVAQFGNLYLTSKACQIQSCSSWQGRVLSLRNTVNQPLTSESLCVTLRPPTMEKFNRTLSNSPLRRLSPLARIVYPSPRAVTSRNNSMEERREWQ